MVGLVVPPPPTRVALGGGGGGILLPCDASYELDPTYRCSWRDKRVDVNERETGERERIGEIQTVCVIDIQVLLCF